MQGLSDHLPLVTPHGILVGAVATALLYPFYSMFIRFLKKAPAVSSCDMFGWDAVSGGSAFPQGAIIYALLMEQPLADFLTGNEPLIALSSLFMLIHIIGQPFRQAEQQRSLTDH